MSFGEEIGWFGIQEEFGKDLADGLGDDQLGRWNAICWVPDHTDPPVQGPGQPKRGLLPAQLYLPDEEPNRARRTRLLAELRRQLANYKRLKALTSAWIALSIEQGRLSMKRTRKP